jgi:hypothetical protein
MIPANLRIWIKAFAGNRHHKYCPGFDILLKCSGMVITAS